MAIAQVSVLPSVLHGSAGPLTPAPISARSAAKLPGALLAALRDVRQAAACNTVPVRDVYAYAYHDLFTADPVERAREQAALRKSLSDSGYDVERLLSPEGLRPYKKAVTLAYGRAVTKDLRGTQLARSGRQAFDEHTFFNCLDYAKATADRAKAYDPSIKLRFFVVMDRASYSVMCPCGPSNTPAGPQRTIVHTMVAYQKDHAWWVVSPETDLTKGDLEIFALGRALPVRFGMHFKINDAPFVRGKDLVYAGSYPFEHPLLCGAVHPQVLKNITAAGTLSLAPEDAICR